jgi:hypothetical protein
MTSKSFLDDNHLQGKIVNLLLESGLFFNDELVSLMTFSKLRLPLQKSQQNRNKESTYELTRF